MVSIKTPPNTVRDFFQKRSVAGLSPSPRIKSRYSLLSVHDDDYSIGTDSSASENERVFLIKDKDDGDDFRYSVEPTEIRWRRHCCGVYAALGLAVTAMGLMAMAAGHLIPAQDPFAGRSAAAAAAADDRDVEAVVADRAAVQFNELLASCRYVGSVMFAAGVVFTVVRFWVSVIRAAGDRKHAVAAAEDDDRRLAEAVGDHLKRAYADRRRSSLHQHQQQQPLPALPHRQAATVRIPVTGSVENVQPDPRAIHLRFDRSS